MKGIRHIFLKSDDYFRNYYSKISLTKLGTFYLIVFVFFALVAGLSSLLTNGNLVKGLIDFAFGKLLIFFLLTGFMTVVPVLIINRTNKKFTFREALKVFLSAELITICFQIATELLALVFSVLANRFGNAVELLGPASVERAGQIGRLGGIGLMLGVFGLVLVCISLIGVLWTVLTEYKGLQIVGKVSKSTALVATISAYAITMLTGLLLTLISIRY